MNTYCVKLTRYIDDPEEIGGYLRELVAVEYYDLPLDKARLIAVQNNRILHLAGVSGFLSTYAGQPAMGPDAGDYPRLSESVGCATAGLL